VTEEQQKVKNWDMLVQYKAEKAELSRMENELNNFVAGWSAFADTFRNRDGKRFKFDAENINVYRQLRGETEPQKVGTLPLKVLNQEGLRKLLRDIKQTRKSVVELARQLGDLV
jgi:hypothetical protein